MKLPSTYGKGFGCGGPLVRRPPGNDAELIAAARLFDQLLAPSRPPLANISAPIGANPIPRL